MIDAPKHPEVPDATPSPEAARPRDDNPSRDLTREQPHRPEDLPKLTPGGDPHRFHEHGRAWMARDGSTNIEIKLADPADRQGFERAVQSGASMGLSLYERAHAVGAGLGAESPHAILLAPREVNQSFQNHGVEDFLREAHAQRGHDTDFYLRTSVLPHEDGRRLHEVTYTLLARPRDAHEDAPARRLFETSITVEGPADRPRILLDAQPLAWTSLDDHLAPRHPARSPNDH